MKAKGYTFEEFMSVASDRVKCEVCRFKVEHPEEWATILQMMKDRGTTIGSGRGHNGRGKVMPRHIAAYVRGKYPKYSGTKFIVTDHFRKHEERP